MDRTIQVLLVHPSPWEGRTFAHGMLVRTGSVTRSEPRRSLEDRDYLGMLLTDQRNMAAAWHGGGEPATVNRLPQPSLFLWGTKRKSPVKGLKVERVSLHRQAGRPVSRRSDRRPVCARPPWRPGASRSAAAWGRTHPSDRCAAPGHCGHRRFRDWRRSRA